MTMPFAIDDLECPTDEQIATFVDGGLRGDEQRIVEAHLAICGDCRELVAATAFMHSDDEQERA